MSKPPPPKRIQSSDILSRKQADPIIVLTAYDALMAGILDTHCDILLVGDSLGMVRLGMENTIAVTLDMMALHGRAVAHATHHAMVVIDMPFGSYQESPQIAYRNAVWLLQETGAQAVKLEGGSEMADTIRFLTQRGIAVMAHIGLTPQHIHQMGGFKVQGRTDQSRQKIHSDIKAIDDTGAFAIVLEGLIEDLAKEVTALTRLPTIGIGASVECDGQVLVTEDMLGFTSSTPKFVKSYADLRQAISSAVEAYAHDVTSRSFPNEDYCYYPNNSKKS